MSEETNAPPARSLASTSILATTILLGWFVACAVDRAAYHALRVDDWAITWATSDLVQMLRSAGYFPTWLLVAIIIDMGGQAGPVPSGLLSRRVRPRVRALGVRVLMSAAMGGLLAEAVKVIVRRHRPSVANDGQHVYDWFGGQIEGRGLGLASSHAGVAFGAAFAIWRWSPPAGVAAMTLALGCSATRLLSGAHFVSDVYAAAVLAFAGSNLAWWVADGMRRRVR